MTKHDDDKYYLMAPLNAHIGEALDYANRADQIPMSATTNDPANGRSVTLLRRVLRWFRIFLRAFRFLPGRASNLQI